MPCSEPSGREKNPGASSLKIAGCSILETAKNMIATEECANSLLRTNMSAEDHVTPESEMKPETENAMETEKKAKRRSHNS